MPADAEAVFDVVSDLDNMTSWLPDSVEVELSGPNLVRLWFPGRHTDLDLEPRSPSTASGCVSRGGSDTTASCTGTLEVLRLTADRSQVRLVRR